MKETNNGFYEFSQDLVIDLQNKPHKFMDLDSLINQLNSIKKAYGNCKVAIVTDRNLKFTYLHRVNTDGQVETDCLYPHKNETLGCTVHHVLIAEDSECYHDLEMDRHVYKSGIAVKHATFDYVSIECIGDDGNRYEVSIAGNELIILSTIAISRDVNMKIIETFVLNDETSIDNNASSLRNNVLPVPDTVILPGDNSYLAEYAQDSTAVQAHTVGIDEPHINPITTGSNHPKIDNVNYIAHKS